MRTRYDLILRNGTIIDGSGRPRFAGNVGISGERIAGLGALGDARASLDLDVAGLVVAPGFIDVHTHDDAALIARPEMVPKLSQGVTTVIGGNCGISGAPYTRIGDPPHLLRLVFKSDRFVASSFADYLEKVRDARPAINSVFLTGHTTLRMQVMGDDLDRTATDSEVQEMRYQLVQCLEQGSLGLSTGLFYPPARAAETSEVIGVARPLKDFGGIYTTHMRDEADGVIDSLEETLRIGRALATAVVVSHHKCMGMANYGRSVETLSLIGRSIQNQAVALDQYPYTAASTVLSKEMVDRADRTLIAWSDPHPEYCARDLNEVTRLLGCSRDETIMLLQPAGAVYFMMDEEDVQRIMRFPATMIGSDGLPEDKHPHPRLWGTFPRVLGRYVRDLGVLSLEEGVHRMTGLSAKTFGMANRGEIEVGRYADLTIFDPGTIRDTATFEQPISAAVGIHTVIVNGDITWRNGAPTGRRNGKVLRRQDLRSAVG